MAICRLKRVAADNRGDIEARLAQLAGRKLGRRIALIGAGCASLTVANDLLPLGYDCVMFESQPAPGGLMRTNIPSFRLPARVLDEEIGYITRLGVDLRLNHPITSLAGLLGQEFDAVFVGSGAPKGKDLELPGRRDSDRIHIGIDWLESIAFGHTTEVGRRVLIIGVGNTAMDCCRSALRLGARDVRVMARKPRAFFKASDWELEDAEEERVEIVVNHSPKAFVIEDGQLTGMRFERLQYDIDADGRIRGSSVIDEVVIPCDDVVLAIGQDNAFPWVERDLGIDFDQVGSADRRRANVSVDPAWCLFRWRRGLRPEEHHLGGRARPSGGHLDSPLLRGRVAGGEAATRHEPVNGEDGYSRVGLQQ